MFFVDGRGGDGSATPLTALYGCSKAGVQQLYRTLVAESASQPKLAVHTVQPGMMITPLLVDKETAIPRRHIKVDPVCVCVCAGCGVRGAVRSQSGGSQALF